MVVQPWTKCLEGQQCPDVLLHTKCNRSTSRAQQHRQNALPRAQQPCLSPTVWPIGHSKPNRSKERVPKGQNSPLRTKAPATNPTRTRPRHRQTSPNIWRSSSQQVANNWTRIACRGTLQHVVGVICLFWFFFFVGGFYAVQVCVVRILL